MNIRNQAKDTFLPNAQHLNFYSTPTMSIDGKIQKPGYDDATSLKNPPVAAARPLLRIA